MVETGLKTPPRDMFPVPYENLRLTKVAYERGGGAFLDVLDAQRRVNENRASLARAEGQRLADAVRLFAATGADWRAAGG